MRTSSAAHHPARRLFATTTTTTMVGFSHHHRRRYQSPRGNPRAFQQTSLWADPGRLAGPHSNRRGSRPIFRRSRATSGHAVLAMAAKRQALSPANATRVQAHHQQWLLLARPLTRPHLARPNLAPRKCPPATRPWLPKWLVTAAPIDRATGSAQTARVGGSAPMRLRKQQAAQRVRQGSRLQGSQRMVFVSASALRAATRRN